MPARMCLVCPRLTTNVDQVDLWRLPTKEGPAISLALSKMHRATEHCSTWTVWSVVWIKQPATPGSHSKLLLTGTVARHPNGILLGHHDLFRLAVGGNTGFRAILQTPLAAKQAICAKVDCCTPRTTASQNPPCSTEQAGHVLCDSSKVCGQVGQVARSRRTSPFLRSWLWLAIKSLQISPALSKAVLGPSSGTDISWANGQDLRCRNGLLYNFNPASTQHPLTEILDWAQVRILRRISFAFITCLNWRLPLCSHQPIGIWNILWLGKASASTASYTCKLRDHGSRSCYPQNMGLCSAQPSEAGLVRLWLAGSPMSNS